jgi:hypothetical protein
MKRIVLASFASILPLVMQAGAFAETQSTSTPTELAHRLRLSRAVEAVIWGVPAVNFDLMLQEFKRIGGKDNQFVYWSRPLDGNNQTLTPNPDSIYFMAFYNTKDVGPVVLEIPPAGDDGSINANIVTVWQMPLEDGGPSRVRECKRVFQEKKSGVAARPGCLEYLRAPGHQDRPPGPAQPLPHRVGA